MAMIAPDASVNYGIPVEGAAWQELPQETGNSGYLCPRGFTTTLNAKGCGRFAYFLPILRTNSRQRHPASAISALMFYLAQNFNRQGNWDYKSKYQPGTPERNQAMAFGNFDFGAVLAGLGFSLNFTQSAAGLAQIYFCYKGGSCGTGIPFIQYPYGDQAVDQKQIVAGYSYEQAVLAGCVH